MTMTGLINRAPRSVSVFLQLAVVTSLLFGSFPSFAAAESLPHASSLASQSLHRALKKSGPPRDDTPAPAPAPAVTPQVVESAFGGNDTEEEEEAELELEGEDYDETEEGNGKDGKDEDKDEDKDEEKDKQDDEENRFSNDEDGEFPVINFVELPEMVCEMGVYLYASNRAGDQSSPRDNYAAIEALMEEYFENLLPRDIMGPNYLSSELEATTSKSQNFGDGSLLDFSIKGKAQYQGEPVPSRDEIKDRLIWFFSKWQGQGDLEAFLEANAINGVTVTNFYVDSEPVSTNTDTSNTDEDGDASISSTSTSSNADSNTGEEGGNGKPVGLIVGLTVLILCILIAAIMLFSARRLLINECGSWCKSARDSVRQKNVEKRGWKDFHEEGSETSLENREVSPSTNETQKRNKWFAWLQRNKTEEEEEPSAVLQQIQVVVDTDNIPKLTSNTVPTRSYSLAERSGQQFSAATVPHANRGGHFDELSPQKTLNMYASDEDEESLDDPVVRYAPPTRSKGRMYKAQKHPWRNNPTATVGSPSTAASTPPPPPLPEQEDPCASGLAEWASYLNPCMMPNLAMFQAESEKLDDLVASLPREKSVLDVNSSVESKSPSPSRRSRRSQRRYREQNTSSSRRHHHKNRREI